MRFSLLTSVLILAVSGVAWADTPPAGAPEAETPPAAAPEAAPEAKPAAEEGGGGDDRGLPEADKELYVAKCASCHTVGGGDRVGPDLKGVHERRDHGWLVRMIQRPSAMLSSDPEARAMLAKFNNVKMPDLDLSNDKVAALIKLIEVCSATTCDLKGKFVPVTDATDEHARRGLALYLGAELQEGGGPACIACHTVSDTGAIVAGGTLAKDLTHVFARLGDEGLDAALKSPAFAVMNKIYEDHPLTTDEAFALRAFLYQANRGELGRLALRASGAGGAAGGTGSGQGAAHPWSVPLTGLLGALLALMVLNALWSRRLRGVRKPLVGGPRRPASTKGA